MSYLKPRNFLLVLALVLALVLIAVIAMRYSPEQQLEAVVKALPKGIDVALEDIDYTHIEDGKPLWRLVSNQVERRADSGILGLTEPELNFFDEQGEPAGSIRAIQGEVSSNYQAVKLRGDVFFQQVGGYTLQTENLDYDHATQKMTTDAHVLMVADGMRLEGKGMTVYLQEKRLQLSADVEGFLDPGKMK
jgi:LPS export ABC transporter protein LptC